jgi:primary-amine oxidase
VARKLEFWKQVPGVQAPITESELDTMVDVVKKDPRVIAALKRHGVTDLSGVRCEPIPITWMIFPEQASGRIGFGDCTDSHGVYHPWGRAIEGVFILADLTSEKVLKVIDNDPVPMSPGDINYEEGDATPRPGTKPLLVTQPLGPSYTIDKGEVVWQNWHFRFRLDPRVGPSHQSGALPGWRPASFRDVRGLALGDVCALHGSDEGWNSRAFVDAGEFLLGGLIKPVGPDDCPAHAQYFTGLVPSDAGAPILKPQLACLFEHAGDGPAWRHLEGDVISARPSRELVLRTAAVAGNYDYLLDWIFQQDGTIRVAVGATGIVETKGVKEQVLRTPWVRSPANSSTAHLVAPNLLAVNHDHYFSYRLDLDVDGTATALWSTAWCRSRFPGIRARSSGRRSPRSPIRRRTRFLIWICVNPSMWHFINPNAARRPRIPDRMGDHARRHGGLEYLARRPGAARRSFFRHQMWVTPYNPDERYAAGTYVTNNEGLRGLPEWTKANRSIENTDIVGLVHAGLPPCCSPGRLAGDADALA